MFCNFVFCQSSAGMVPVLFILLQLLRQTKGSQYDTEIVVHPDGSTSVAPRRRLTACGDFSSTIINPTFASFGVQITCPANAVARCIAWMVYPEDGSDVNAGDLENKANFWSYSNIIVQQNGGVTPAIIVKDAVSEGSCQRVISFPNLPTNARPTWDVRCSYTGVCILIFIDIFTELVHIMTESLKYIELSQRYNKCKRHY